MTSVYTVPSVVYIIAPASGVGPHKIGRSRFIDSRLDQLMAWSPIPLKVVWTTPGYAALERILHDRFSESWSHREWFKPTPDLLDGVSRLISGVPVEVIAAERSGISIAKARRGPIEVLA